MVVFVLKSILLLSLAIGFILTIIEYILLRKMVPFYYCNGPFATTETFRSLHDKNTVINRLQTEKGRTLVAGSSHNCILVSYKPSLKLWFSRGEFPTQRIVLTFLEEGPGFDVRCDIRPFYSAFVLAILITLVIVIDVIVPNQYAGIPMKIFGSIVACGIGLALFLPFRPRTDTVNRIKSDVKSTEELRNRKLSCPKRPRIGHVR